jgi:dUTP pyrophosphatase
MGKIKLISDEYHEDECGHTINNYFVKLKRLHKDAIMPTYETTSSACADLYSIEDVTFRSKDLKFVRIGWSMEVNPGFCIEIYNRSSLSSKKELIIVSSRIIDADYRGEILVPMKLIADLPIGWVVKIKKGDRIAQMMVKQAIQCGFEEVTELSETNRGSGGFGSTGR